MPDNAVIERAPPIPDEEVQRAPPLENDAPVSRQWFGQPQDVGDQIRGAYERAAAAGTPQTFTPFSGVKQFSDYLIPPAPDTEAMRLTGIRHVPSVSEQVAMKAKGAIEGIGSPGGVVLGAAGVLAPEIVGPVISATAVPQVAENVKEIASGNIASGVAGLAINAPMLAGAVAPFTLRALEGSKQVLTRNHLALPAPGESTAGAFLMPDKLGIPPVIVPPERWLNAPSIKLPEQMPVFEKSVIPPERQLTGTAIPLPETFPGEQGPIPTHGTEPGEIIQRISLPIEPESAKAAREIWSKPIDVETQVTGAEALRSIISITDESKTPGQPYQMPSVNVDLRQLERLMQRNTISKVESWADETIQNKLKLTSANPYFDPEFLAAASIKAAILVKRGITNFGEWSGRMKEQFGPGIESHLQPLFDQATGAYGTTGNEKQIINESQQVTPSGFPIESGKGVSTIPSNDAQALGIRLPLSLPGMSAIHNLVVGGTEEARLFLKGAAGESLPRIVSANPEAGEAGISYASARVAAPLKAQLFVQDALRGTNVDPVSFGAAITEDNLRSVKEQRLAAGEDPADVNVNTIIGKQGSPFQTEASYQAFLADPATQQAVTQYKATWDAVKEPQYRLAASIDPATPLATRGLQTGARINLFGVKAGTPPPTGVRIAGGGGGGNLLATLKRKSPFARKATGESDSYVIDLRNIMANSMEKEYAIAMKNKMDNLLVEKGDAAILKEGQDAPTLKGEETVRFPYRRLTVVKEDAPAVPLNANLWVRKSLANEYRAVHGTDAPLRLPGITRIGETLTRASLVGLSEGTIHVSNLMTGVITRPGPTSSVLANAALKAFGRMDVPVTLVHVVRNALTASTKQLASLAEIGALKEPYQGTMLSPFLNRLDKGIRITLDNVYQGMKDKGLVEDTPASRREFINQVGQYNKRLQGPIIRALRETQVGPFATAGRAFNVLGARTAILSPGIKSATAAHAAALRGEQIAGIVGIGAIAAAWNYAKTGQISPPGVRLGDLYLSTEPNGRQHTLALSDMLGYGRAMRVTGARGVIEAKRSGLSTAEAIDKGLSDVSSAALGPAMGPLPNFISMATAGKRATLLLDANATTEAPKMPPDSSVPQRVANLGYAAVQANPIAGTGYDIYQGKLPSEIAARQLTRFAPRSAPSADLIDVLPRIVTKQRMEDYIDDIARRARKLSPDAAEKLFDTAREAIDNLDDPKLKREGKEKLKGKMKFQ